MNIILNVIRDTFTRDTTVGKLYINGDFFCYTLEDVLRPKGLKIAKHTCIPSGVYNLKLTMSHRFQRILPLIIDVPNYTGVRIHGGNNSTDTEGCILLGYNFINENTIQNSMAVKDLIVKLSEANKKITLIISEKF